MKKKMALYFKPGGPVVAGIGTSGFMGGIIFTVTRQQGRGKTQVLLGAIWC